jgi:hypothetical protein
LDIATDPEMILRKKHTEEILKASEKTSDPVIPVQMKITYTITVLPDAVPDGETIRCWLPFPKEGHPRQNSADLLSTSEKKYIISPEEAIVEPGSVEIFQYPFVHLTGHGNVVFNPDEVQNLRKYLISGGFLHLDDNFGMDKFIRREMKKVFPELDFVEVPFSHPIYHQKYNFEKGLPKVHQHDGKPPQGFGLFFQGRLICFYSFECDLGNGWEDQDIYNDPENIRQQALKMGANILQYVFAN